MKKNQSAYQWSGLLAAVSVLTFALSGCSGSDGGAGPAGAPGATVGVTSPATATALTMAITGATVDSPPVVNFTVTDQNGVPVAGLVDTDLRFNIAKLVPGTNGDPSKWQNYINRASGGAVQGSQERKTTTAGYRWGTLIDNKNGTYTYTFATDITSSTDNVCPAPCTDADGNALDISYQPTLTTRVGIQMSNTAYPKVNATYDFVPAGGAVTTTRDIVQTANCNVCHNQLTAHGSRVETKLCATCHNPGSWVAGASGSPNTTVDFKVYIHKIHRGENLPSVVAGTLYKIGNSDFSDVVFPQDIRNCTKCHDGTTTAQGDNWETRPSIAACGSCHDDVYFGASPDPLKPYQTVAHPGGVVTDNSECTTCHAANRIAGSIAEKHTIQSKVARGKFKFNIISICGTAVASKPICAPGTIPTVTFSVTDPTLPLTDTTTHGYGYKYNIFADPEFCDSVNNKALASMSIDIAWDTHDYNNTGGYAARPSRANQVNVFGATTNTTNYGNATIAAPLPAAASNGNGTYTVTALGPIPDGTVWPNVSATGSGVVAIEGRAFNTITDPGLTGSAATRIPIKGEVAYFRITDASPVARRVVADAQAKCDNCHDQLSLHGGSRNDNVQLCVLCHNPNNTDAQASFRTKYPNGLTQVIALDGKKEEAVDFKRMIHGIHAGAKTSLDGTKTLSGFRTKGLVVSGTDFSDVRFPGILNNCANCHTGTTYQLTGIWDTPTQNGILGSTIDSTPGLTSANTAAEVNASLQNPADDLNISPTAAACSSCHDDALAQQHMIQVGSALFSATQATINTNLETCSICHGPGNVADVKVVHGVK